VKKNYLVLIGAFISSLISCSKQDIIEIALTQQFGYGHFQFSLGGISTYSEDENNPWKDTYLKVSGIPDNWKEIKIGDIEFDFYQSVYQDYLLGKISQQRFEELQKAWSWIPDTLQLSQEPLRTKVAFVYGNDSIGRINMIVDRNNNLDFSDDESFLPYEWNSESNVNIDSIALSRTITISFEQLVDNKIVEVNTPVFITYLNPHTTFMVNFPQYYTASFLGERIAICSDGFTSLSYEKPGIALINNTLKEGEKINYEDLIVKNEYIEIKGNIYRNLGVDLNKKTLLLKKMKLPRNKLNSTQIGYKTYNFEGIEFSTQSNFRLDDLKGKYVLLDFWAVWCGPCLQEIPKLKKLYEITDREKFEIIGIVADSPTDALSEIITKNSITWPQIQSTDANKIKEKYGISGYPTIFLLDTDGIIIAKGMRFEELEEKVLGLLRE
jgi:thiol-disulfide isomerase/thioredoxin